jgi:acetolactate synthase-1/2/3 large subunit
MIDIRAYDKPLIVAGHGIRLADAIDDFYKLIDKLQILVVTTFNGFDLMPSDHPLFKGRIGTVGTPEGNKVLQESDCVIFMGTRNNIRQISYQWQNFANNACKIIIDIDKEEIKKPTIKADIYYNMDLKKFIQGWLNDLSV